jgi:hypothetical protein
MDDGPSAEELARVAVAHLRSAGPRAMVSFGQGCEGEPLTRYRVIAEAIRRIRAETDRGSLHINTNASLTAGLAALYDAGLDSIRVSLNSAVADLYEAYYQPDRYGWRDVEASIALSRERAAYLALNLLTFPGVSDREGEVEALLSLVRRHRVDQLQTRSLCIDPLQYLEVARDRGAGGRPMGIARMVQVQGRSTRFGTSPGIRRTGEPPAPLDRLSRDRGASRGDLGAPTGGHRQRPLPGRPVCWTLDLLAACPAHADLLMPTPPPSSGGGREHIRSPGYVPHAGPGLPAPRWASPQQGGPDPEPFR